MKELEIEEVLSKVIDEWLASHQELSFSDNGEDDGFSAYWHHKHGWDVGNSEVEPLSLLLLKEQPEREKHGDDCFATATLSVFLGQSIGFVRSFQDGWYGLKNGHTSISGYLLGRKLRLKYLKE